jgi:predicted component of type VI protein secretion system
VKYPDGKEECRAVDHDLLFGRLDFCHVQFADTRLSRLNALLACHDGVWYVHNLTRKVIGRNRKAVHHLAHIADGDELLIGPLVVRVELHAGVGETPPPPARSSGHSTPLSLRHPAGSPTAATDVAEATDDGTGERAPAPNIDALRASAQRLDNWLKSHPPRAPENKGGIGGWLEAQRDRLRRFWYDTPETTSARSLRTLPTLRLALASRPLLPPTAADRETRGGSRQPRRLGAGGTGTCLRADGARQPLDDRSRGEVLVEAGGRGKRTTCWRGVRCAKAASPVPPATRLDSSSAGRTAPGNLAPLRE